MGGLAKLHSSLHISGLHPKALKDRNIRNGLHLFF